MGSIEKPGVTWTLCALFDENNGKEIRGKSRWVKFKAGKYWGIKIARANCTVDAPDDSKNI